jgi:hypothetical protein
VDANGKTEEIIFSANQVTADIDAGYKDMTAPDVTPASDIIVNCDGAGNEVELKNWLLNHGGATAADNLSGNLIWTDNYATVSKECGGSGEVKVTFAVIDECGNKSTTSATFRIKDTQAPVFAEAPKNLKLKCGDVVPAAATPSVSDVCDVAPVVSTNETRQALCGSSYKIVRTWTAQDACGNSAQVSQEISFEDNEPPVMLNVPTKPVTLSCSQPIPNGAGVTAKDNCDGEPKSLWV